MSATSSTSPVPGPGLLRRPLWLMVLVAIAAAGAYFLLRPKPTTQASAYHVVKRGDFTVSIVEGGTLTAVTEVSIRNEVEGTARIIFLIPEGSYVKKGDLLVELDSSQAQDQVNQQRINFEKAQFALIQAQQQLEIQRSTTNSDISAALLKVKFADMDLEKFLTGQKAVDLLEARNKLVQAQAQLAVNELTYSNTVNLANKGYETKQREDGDRLTVLNNQNAVIVASNTMVLLQKFDIKKQEEKFASDLAEARKELDRVVAQSERRIAQYVADLITQSNTLVLNGKKLERDETNLEKTKILAPQDGLVVFPTTDGRFSNESLIEEGATVRNRQELIKLPDVSRMKVVIKVHESHVSMVQAGQPAFVVLDSMPDTRFRAYVDKVALLPDSQSRFGNPNLKVYNTDVVITEPLPNIKPGVSARAEVVVTNIADAISVPIQAVTSYRGKQVVYVDQGGETVPVPVEVGVFNTKFIEIAKGLSGGERILLSPPFDADEKSLDGGILAANEKVDLTRTNIPSGRGAGTNNLANAPAGPSMTSPANGSGPNGRPRLGPGVASQNRNEGPDATLSPGGPDAAGGQRGQGRRGNFNPEEMMKQFDKDGDGQLSDSEREAMRAEMTARFGGQGPGGGQRLSREEMLKRFDANSDGELDETERAAMRAQMGGGRSRGTNAPPRGEFPGGLPAGQAPPVTPPSS